MSTFVESENNSKTFIIYLLDESGSMYNTKDDTLGTRNKCIEEMKSMKVDGEETEPSFIYYTFSQSKVMHDLLSQFFLKNLMLIFLVFYI